MARSTSSHGRIMSVVSISLRQRSNDHDPSAFRCHFAVTCAILDAGAMNIRRVGTSGALAMISAFAIAVAFIIATCLPLRADPHCLRHIDNAVCPRPSPAVRGWKIANTLCCCKTYTGGECCTQMAQCGGKPPGCFCASESVPAPKKPFPKQLSDGRLAGY